MEDVVISILLVIVGLVIALIITVILPMVTDAEDRQVANETNAQLIDEEVADKIDTGLANWD